MPSIGVSDFNPKIDLGCWTGASDFSLNRYLHDNMDFVELLNGVI